jgi:CheY-like chemotaxis protein
MLHCTIKDQAVVDVLLVDSVPLVRQLVADMLEDVGLRVIAATEDAAEAQAALARGGSPTPAVLVVAVRCPMGGCSGVVNGRALATELRRRLNYGDDRTGPQSLGVVYFGEHVSALGGDALGPAEQFLSEPFGHAALVRAVFGAIGREMPRWLAGRVRARPALRA